MGSGFERIIAVPALLAGMVVILCAGCGGGDSADLGDSPAGGGQTVNYGSLSGRVVGTAQPPVTSGGSGTVVTGIAGATFTNLVLATPKLTPANSASLLLQATRIAYDVGGNVYVSRADGSGATRLTSPVATFGNPSHPTWSPDGTQIAYQWYDDTLGRFQIYVMNADGSNPRRISSGTQNAYAPAWSPDGTRIAYQEYVPAVSHDQIVVVTPTGGSKVRISDGTAEDSAPAWSPDSAQIAFQRYDTTAGRQQIYLMTRSGANAHRLAETLSSFNQYSPAWSPDATRVALTLLNGTSQQIWLWPVIPSSVGAFDGGPADGYPAWSPDGSVLAFTRTASGISSIVTRATIYGSAAVPVTSPSGPSATMPAWSPYPAKRTVVGAGGALGTAAAGFLFGQQGDSVTSLVAFSATTPSAARVTTQTGIAPGNSNYVFTVTAADSLTALSYINGAFSAPVKVIGSGGAASAASAALVTFTAATGTVSAVLPYVANRSASPEPAVRAPGGVLVFHRAFLGVWDGAGKNLAPNGATEARIDAATGNLVGVR